MAEYISREEAIKNLREVYEHEYPTASGDFDEYASHDVPNVLRNMPAADVQPVRHAKCERDNEGYERCSACNEHETNLRYFNFCPHCGAKLDVIYQDGKLRAIKVV